MGLQQVSATLNKDSAFLLVVVAGAKRAWAAAVQFLNVQLGISVGLSKALMVSVDAQKDVEALLKDVNAKTLALQRELEEDNIAKRLAMLDDAKKQELQKIAEQEQKIVDEYNKSHGKNFTTIDQLPIKDDKAKELNSAKWAKDDPFWDQHQPGDHWNCKCDWHETSAPVTDNTFIPKPSAARGLQGNPGKTGRIFSEGASYFKNLNEDGKKVMERMVKPLVKENVWNWKEKSIPSDTGIDITDTAFAPGSMVIKRNSIKSCFSHTNDNMLRIMLPTLSKAKYKHIGWQNTEVGKHLDAPYFLYYEVKLNGSKYYANIKASIYYKREILYCPLTQPPKDIKDGLPPDIKDYKK